MLRILRRRAQVWWSARHPASDLHRMGQRNVYILPTRPGMFFCATLAVLLLASINDQLSLGYALTFLLAGAGFASMHATHATLAGLSLDLRAPQPGFAGDELALEIRLHNSGRARWGIGIGRQGEPADRLAWCDVPARGHAQLQLRIPATLRGLQPLPTLRIETRFPLGLFRAWSVWRPAAQVWIYPRPEAGAPQLPREAARAEAGEQASARPLAGPDLEGVRAYQRGDSARQVLWKKAAQGEASQAPLMVRDTLAPASRRLWLDLAATAGLDWEARLSRLCAWVLDAEAQALSYGLRLDASELPPGQGTAQRLAALQRLAEAEPRPGTRP